MSTVVTLKEFTLPYVEQATAYEVECLKVATTWRVTAIVGGVRRPVLFGRRNRLTIDEYGLVIRELDRRTFEKTIGEVWRYDMDVYQVDALCTWRVRRTEA